MDYKDFKGDIYELIAEKLAEIEEKENVKIIHAVESGSRSWGFASPDSDYDVRFIYIREVKDYLKVNDAPDFIDWELNEVMDINGWDLKKALRLFYKSNATLFEWANSPIVYKTTEQWENIYDEAKACFNIKGTLYHYYGIAKNNFYTHLQEDLVKYKKYFYSLRPILACKWIEERKCPPPVYFGDLLKIEEDLSIVNEINKLVEAKVQMLEGDKAPKIDAINNYLKDNLERYEKLLNELEKDSSNSWDKLNKVFLENLDLK